MSMRKSIVIVAMAALGLLSVSTAHAGWGDLFCDISNGSASSLQKAIGLYSDPDEGDRYCKLAIRFKAKQTIVLPEGFTIDRTPPSGQTYGFSIRKCVSASDNVTIGDEPFVEPGCPDLSETNVELDVSGTDADCPITIYSGSKIDIQKIKIIVKNPAKAICTPVGNAIPLEDKENNYAWIHDVTLCAASDPTCNTVVGDADGDGVPDSDDRCPNTPGSASNHGCIPDGGGWEMVPRDTDSDRDHDGIPDDDDLCDDQPGPVSNDGCPIDTDDDQDGDGFSDDQDLCDAGTPGGGNPPAGADDTCPGDIAAGRSVACSQTQDMDHDDIGDRCDSDIDGDTLSNGSDPDPYDADADNDGVNDNLDQCPLDNQATVTPCNPVPTDPTETDPDGDGLTTTLEEALETRPDLPDTDGDGYMDGVDCYPNDATRQTCGATTIVVDPDSDNDGICDAAVSETDPVTGTPCTPNPLGAADNCSLVSNPDQADADADGIGDACEQVLNIVVENDGDSDGIPDDLEVSVFLTDPNNPDTDGDGLSDGDEVYGMTYQDGAGPLNPDVDADGICDGPTTVTEIPATCPDGKTDDEEGCDTSEHAVEICNAGPVGTGDNCPIVENSEQEDTDGDGVGDGCQGDIDGDGIPDVGDEETPADNCPFVKNENQEDSDGDGIGDECDISVSASGLGPEGCGCRIDGKSQGRTGDLLPFLAMILPMLILRRFRKREEA